MVQPSSFLESCHSFNLASILYQNPLNLSSLDDPNMIKSRIESSMMINESNIPGINSHGLEKIQESFLDSP
jgi:hypothetical protein